MNEQYWIIDYKIRFLSDYHVGAGISLMGGNLNGLRLDEDNLPFMPHTQVRGLLRQRGSMLNNWMPHLAARFKRNFGLPAQKRGNCWSFTRASFPGAYQSGDSAEWSSQSHIKIGADQVAVNLFTYQKGGAIEDHDSWRGRIYSIEPSEEADVAFMIAAMRADDRIGHRRSRGYGKVDWQLEQVRSYNAGGPTTKVCRPLQEWLELALEGGRE